MVLTFENNDAARSLDKQQMLDWHRGWQVIDPAGGSNLVTVGTGNFEYDAAAGDINAGGTTVTCSLETVDFANDIDADNDQLAVIYRDSSGNLQKTVGSTGTRDPAGQTVRQTHTPAAPSMHATDGVVLAEVLLPAGASSIGSDELRDRRLGDDLDVYFASVTTDDLSTKDSPWADVTAFGAVGDGATDDTQAIQDALDNAQVVYFPPVSNPGMKLSGDYYRATGNINIPDYTTIYAPGWAGKIGWDSKPTGSALTVGRRAEIWGLFGYYETGGASAGSWPAIFQATDEEAKYFGCKTFGDNRAATGGFDFNVNGQIAVACDAEEVQDGFRLQGGSPTVSCHFLGGLSFNCGQGIDIESGANNNYIYSHRSHSCDRGFNIAGDHNHIGFGISISTTFGFYFSGAAADKNEVTHAFVKNPDTGGIRFDGDENHIDSAYVYDDRGTPEISWAVNDLGTDNRIDSLKDENGAGFANRGTGSVYNGLGQESAAAETPTAANYRPGDIVDFTDSGDGSGTGQYLLLADGTTWVAIA